MNKQNDIIIKKIKELKNIKPRQEWKDLTKVFLLSKIEKRTVELNHNAHNAQKSWFNQSFFGFFKKNIRQNHYFKTTAPSASFWAGFKPKVFLKTTCLLLLFVIMSGGMFAFGFESQKSLPGDFLYSIKKSIEKTKITFSPSSKKAQLHTDLADRRLEELNEIVNKPNSVQEKKEKVKETIKDFRKEIEATKVALIQPEINKSKPKKTKTEIVKTVKTKTDEFKEILEKVPEQIPKEIKEEVKEDIDKALESTEETGFIAIEQIVVSEDIPNEEKLVLVMSEIEKVENEMKEIKEKVEKIDNNEIKTKENKIKKENLQEQKEKEEKAEKRWNNFLVYLIIKSVQAEEDSIQKEVKIENNDITDDDIQDNFKAVKIKALEDIKKAEKLLEKAKKCLEKKDFKTALNFISASKELIKNAKESIVKNIPSEEFIDESNKNENENSDSIDKSKHEINNKAIKEAPEKKALEPEKEVPEKEAPEKEETEEIEAEEFLK